MSNPGFLHEGSGSEPKITVAEAAQEVILPSSRNSVDYDLHPVSKHDKVAPSADIIKDKRSGKHYRRVKKPEYSIAKSKGAARIDHSAYRGAPIGLGHTLPHASSSKAHDDAEAQLVAREQAMFDRMRLMMREEIRNSNRGHHDQIKQHIEDALEKTKEEDSSNDTTHTYDKKIKTKLDDDGNTVLDPTSAVRGTSDSDEGDEPEFPNPWAKIRYHCREPFAEFLACFVLLTFGDGINVQVQLSALVDPSAPKGSYLSISLGRYFRAVFRPLRV
jgi:aquaglyceroporin related protein